MTDQEHILRNYIIFLWISQIIFFGAFILVQVILIDDSEVLFAMVTMLIISCVFVCVTGSWLMMLLYETHKRG